MKKSNTYTAAKTALLFAFVLVLTGSLFAQSESKKDSIVSASPTTQTVNSQQGERWAVGIDSLHVRPTWMDAGGNATVSITSYLEDLPAAP